VRLLLRDLAPFMRFPAGCGCICRGGPDGGSVEWKLGYAGWWGCAARGPIP
jgi:hypothetical protein